MDADSTVGTHSEHPEPVMHFERALQALWKQYHSHFRGPAPQRPVDSVRSAQLGWKQR
jgi:hypothetical protein